MDLPAGEVHARRPRAPSRRHRTIHVRRERLRVAGRYPGHGRELAEGLPAVRDYFERLHEESVRIFAALSNEDLERRCTTPGGTPIAVWKWLRSMVEHEVHHRGQLYLYLAMLEIPTPPLYGLTEEQVRELSKAHESGVDRPVSQSPRPPV